MSSIPDISVDLKPGSSAFSRNGTWEAGQMTASSEKRMVRLSSVSRRLHRKMNSGFLLDPADLDEFCRRWLAGRKG